MPGAVGMSGFQVTSSSYGYYYSLPQLYGPALAYSGFDVYGQTATASEAKSVNNLASAVVAYQLGASLAHDHLGPERVANLRQSHILLVDCSAGSTNQDPRVKLIVESLGAAMVAQVSLELLQQSTALNQNTRTIILLGTPRNDSSNFPTPSEAAIHRLTQFVNDGGHIISIGNAIHYINSIFSLADAFEITNRYILQKLASKIQVVKEDAETQLFSGFDGDAFAVLEPNNVLVKILDPTKVEVLCKAKELARKLKDLDTLAFRVRHGKGLITHLTSVFLRKKKLHINMPQHFEKELRKQDAAEATVTAWKFAVEMGFSESFWEADSASPFQQFLIGIIISHPIPTPKPTTKSAASSSTAPSEPSTSTNESTSMEGVTVKEEAEESNGTNHDSNNVKDEADEDDKMKTT